MCDALSRRCCASIWQVLEVCESSGSACVTQMPAFRANCLNLSVLQLSFYEQYEKHQYQLSKDIHESVFFLASLFAFCTFLKVHFSLANYNVCSLMAYGIHESDQVLLVKGKGITLI